jgi:anti-sigma B factor antagonist
MPAFIVRGPLDVSTAATLRAQLVGLLATDGTDDLVVDLHRMGPLDSVGLGLLVAIHRQAQRGGRRLVLIGVPPRVMRVLTATRLRRVLTVDVTGPLDMTDPIEDGLVGAVEVRAN